MKDLFADIMALTDMLGAVVLDADGQIAYQVFTSPPAKEITVSALDGLIQHLYRMDEAELIFDNIRIVVRSSDGFIVVLVMGRFAPMAMVRLNCDIILPNLKKTTAKGKGLARLFKR